MAIALFHCKKKDTPRPTAQKKNNAAVSSILTRFVALDFREKLVSQEKIPALHCHEQILFFSHNYNLNHRRKNLSQSTAEDAFFVFSALLRVNSFSKHLSEN